MNQQNMYSSDNIQGQNWQNSKSSEHNNTWIKYMAKCQVYAYKFVNNTKHVSIPVHIDVAVYKVQ